MTTKYIHPDGTPLTGESIANLQRLGRLAANLFDGENYNDHAASEYLRGQVELIADAIGFDGDSRDDYILPLIFPTSYVPMQSIKLATGYTLTVSKDAEGRISIEGDDGHTNVIILELDAEGADELGATLVHVASL